MAFVVAVCFLLVITSFIIPALAAFFYIPLFLLLMLFAGVLFMLRYFGIHLPIIRAEMQDEYAAKGDFTTLIIGIAFLIGFLTALFTICTKRSKFKHIVPVLKIAKACFWSNCYIIIFSFIFSIFSVAFLVLNYVLFSLALTKKEPLIDPIITSAIIIVELLMTHGIMEAVSDFFFESIAVHWYFKQRRE